MLFFEAKRMFFASWEQMKGLTPAELGIKSELIDPIYSGSIFKELAAHVPLFRD
jgi:hypothetical protein